MKVPPGVGPALVQLDQSETEEQPYFLLIRRQKQLWLRFIRSHTRHVALLRLPAPGPNGPGPNASIKYIQQLLSLIQQT